MPREDALRWNDRYRNAAPDWYASARSILTGQPDLFSGGGLALDVAMGMGANAGFLLDRGWRVIGIDISDVAVFQAKNRYPALEAAIGDLVRLSLPADRFDLILNLYYLDRDLWPVYRRALKPGGLLVIETLMREMITLKNDLNPHFLLEPGELHAAFQDWQILYEREGWTASDHGSQKSIASLIARRP